jgi:calpain-7
MPLRDRGLYRTDFTLQAFAPDHLSIDLERISTTLPFSTTIKGNLTGRNAGGHAGLPSWIDNPQFKLTVAASQGSRRVAADKLRVMLQGDTDMAWNVKVLWGKGELVSE